MNKAVVTGTIVIVALIVALFCYQRFVDSRLSPEDIEAIRMEMYEESQAEAKAQAVANAEAEGQVVLEELEKLESMEEYAARYPDRKFVTIQTQKGDIVLELFADRTPVTVASFVNLIHHNYYDGLVFHRVIPDFMIQGGCPLGTGTGDPGYSFEDEPLNELKFDRPGLLAMANSGPATNGSQFFITHANSLPEHLNGKHTIFGRVLAGQDVVEAIEGDDKMIQLELAGDFSELLESQKDRVAEWNKKLGPVE